MKSSLNSTLCIVVISHGLNMTGISLEMSSGTLVNQFAALIRSYILCLLLCRGIQQEDKSFSLLIYVDSCQL